MTAPAPTARPTAAPATAAPPHDPPDASPRALLWWVLRARRRDLALAALFFSTHQLGEALVPVVVGAAVGDAVQDGTPGELAGWLGLLAADFLLLSLSYRFGARAAQRAAQHAEHLARGRLTAAVLRPTGGVRLLPGDLLSRAAGDASRVGACARTLASTVAAVVVLLAATLLLVRISPLLGALVVVGTAALLAAQNRLSGTLRRTSAAEQARQADAAALAEDLVRGRRVLKGIGAERTVAADYARVSRDAVLAARRAASAEAALLSLGTVFTGLYLTAVAAAGGSLALDGRLGLGEFIAALGLARFVIGPMRVVAAARAGYARAIASAGRVHEVLTTPPAVTDLGGVTGVGSGGEALAGGDAGGVGGAGRVALARTGAGGGVGRLGSAGTGAGGGAGRVASVGTGAGGDAGSGADDGGGAGFGVGDGGEDGFGVLRDGGGRGAGIGVGDGCAVGAGAAAGAAAGAGGPVGDGWGVEFRGVRLADGFVLDARVPGGSLTGLVCDAPAVAEAVAALLARESDPAGGAVLLGGTDLTALPLDTLRATALVCPHEPALLPATHGYNNAADSYYPAPTPEAPRAAHADRMRTLLK
ncbi:ABC transporter transmembrane domain-containing protein, partial [Streptomyces sp. NPDC096080]|uniref:ABC transporter transmembrane domain-containing protein n=1 Tax=Streptomyces sp. NPDC096080 TaxID=3156693 RepID=UPI0033196412